MPPSGVALQSLRAGHPQAALLARARHAIGFTQMALNEGAANRVATLKTPAWSVHA